MASHLIRDYKNANRFKPNHIPPRLTFNGYVEFVFSPELQLLSNDGTKIYREQIGSLLQSATLPSASFNTQVKKQYNIKRVVQTGVEYNPIRLTVLDTVNNEWLILLMRYFSFFYMNPRGKTAAGTRDLAPLGYDSSKNILTKSSSFKNETFESNAAGFNLTDGGSFFEYIKMVVYHGGRGTEYIVFKPTLTEFDTGEINYTESALRTFSMTLDYEGFTVNGATNFKLSDDDLSRFEQVSPDLLSSLAPGPSQSDQNPIYKGSDSGSPLTSLAPQPRNGQ